jgi:DNA-binding CsgD family transcriptional regulator
VENHLLRKIMPTPGNGKLDAMTFAKVPSRSLGGGPTLNQKEGDVMKDQTVRLGPREQQIVDLLLQGCDNAEIASQLNMARRTVKAHFNRLFLRFGITGGIKRVKLATLLYRRQTCPQVNVMGTVSPVNVNTESSNSLPKA